MKKENNQSIGNNSSNNNQQSISIENNVTNNIFISTEITTDLERDNYIFDNFDDLKKVVALLLQENKEIFDLYGPNNYDIEDKHNLWLKNENIILQNNEKIKTIFQQNPRFFSSDEVLNLISNFNKHVREFKDTRGELLKRYAFFPNDINILFGIEKNNNVPISQLSSSPVLTEPEEFGNIKQYLKRLTDKNSHIYQGTVRHIFDKMLKDMNFKIDINNDILHLDNRKYKLIYEYILTQEIYYILCMDYSFDTIVNLYGWNVYNKEAKIDDLDIKQCTANLEDNHKYLTLFQFYKKIYKIKKTKYII